MAKIDAGPALTPHIQFLSFDGCPFADAARAALERALQDCGLSVEHYETVDILDSSTPERLAGWGSPTILVNGKDVSGQVIGDGAACRLYDTADKVPDIETIARFIRTNLAV